MNLLLCYNILISLRFQTNFMNRILKQCKQTKKYKAIYLVISCVASISTNKNWSILKNIHCIDFLVNYYSLLQFQMIKIVVICLIIYLSINADQYDQFNNQVLLQKIKRLTKFPVKSQIQSHHYKIDINSDSTRFPSQHINHHLSNPFQLQHKLNTTRKQVEFIITVCFISFCSLAIVAITISLCMIKYRLHQYSCCKQIFQNGMKDIKVIIKFNYIPQRDYCVICLSNGCDLILQCTHYFHRQCFKQWMKRMECCPICKSKQIDYLKIMICMKCKQNYIVIRKQEIFTYEIQEKCCLNNQMIIKQLRERFDS